jgi:hypothetical protein
MLTREKSKTAIYSVTRSLTHEPSPLKSEKWDRHAQTLSVMRWTRPSLCHTLSIRLFLIDYFPSEKDYCSGPAMFLSRDPFTKSPWPLKSNLWRFRSLLQLDAGCCPSPLSRALSLRTDQQPINSSWSDNGTDRQLPRSPFLHFRPFDGWGRFRNSPSFQ